jgi:Nitrile hydratase beta subunit
MNGVHDMGGMQCMGQILHEQNEPVFHERWEGRMEALYRAMGAWHKWNIDSARYERCLIPPAEYLGNSYYQNSFLQVRSLLVKRGLVTPEEIESSVPAQGFCEAFARPEAGWRAAFGLWWYCRGAEGGYRRQFQGGTAGACA